MSKNHNDLPSEANTSDISDFDGIVSDIHSAELEDETELGRVILEGNAHFLRIAGRLMRGEGESEQSMQDEFVSAANLLDHAFRAYIKRMLEVDDGTAIVESLVDMLLADEWGRVEALRTLVEPEKGLENFKTTPRAGVLESVVKACWDADDIDEKADILIQKHRESITQDVNALYELAPKNAADAKRARNAKIKEKVKKGSAEVSKIAAGALIALIVDRNLRR